MSHHSPMKDDADDDEYSEDEGIWNTIRGHLNFYRIHIIFSTFTRLIFSGIFYASNGQYHISYIDALFNCISAMTVCGLVTVDLRSPVFISWVVVLLRRHYFTKKFDAIIARYEAERVANALADAEKLPSSTITTWRNRTATFIRHGGANSSIVIEASRTTTRVEKKPEKKPGKQSIIKKLRPDMIRRMDDALL